jgi:uncharacterized protein (UPF0332 family)
MREKARKDLINYRLSRAKDTYDDAKILADKNKRNSAINRLYYAAYYAVMALLLKADLKPTTHNGAKSLFRNILLKMKFSPKIWQIIFSTFYLETKRRLR